MARPKTSLQIMTEATTHHVVQSDRRIALNLRGRHTGMSIWAYLTPKQAEKLAKKLMRLAKEIRSI